jgi:ADP-dependent NAD(P)H-hydrate dehydratase / NAD(P)H-hydrate epimerase
MSDRILSAQEVQRIERSAFSQGVDAETLMDQAGLGIANAILGLERKSGVCLAYLGKGNNAGDALVACAALSQAGWEVWIRQTSPELQPLPAKKLQGLKPVTVDDPLGKLRESRPRIILDGILGLGSRPQLSPALAAYTKELNMVRDESGANTYAIDLPTGLGEEGVDPDAVVADVTLTIGFPKKALMQDEATRFVGRISVVDLEDLSNRAGAAVDQPILSGPVNLRHLVSRRPFDSHKGNMGRVGIVAGSRGLVGAAVMSAEAAARAGAGLTYLYVPEEIYPFIVTKVTPEVMVKPVDDLRSVLSDRLDAIGLGPGFGHSRSEETLEIVSKFAGPMVVDADALNMLAGHTDRLKNCAGARLLTPHPGEMARIWETKDKSRSQIVLEFTKEYPVALLLKGARTLVGQSGKPLAFNSTGTPGLATGGSGDILTGVCSALLGRGIAEYDAGRLGAWLCGRAAELAVADSSEESMLPTDLFRYFGQAFRQARRR